MTCPALRDSIFVPPRRLLFFVSALLVTQLAAVEVEAKKFDVPAGAAEHTLRQFSSQSGVQLAYATDLVRGVQTNAIRGEYPPVEALEKMVAGTPLTVVRDEKPGAFAIKRIHDPNAHRAARKTAGDRPAIPNRPILPTNHPRL